MCHICASYPSNMHWKPSCCNSLISQMIDKLPKLIFHCSHDNNFSIDSDTWIGPTHHKKKKHSSSFRHNCYNIANQTPKLINLQTKADKNEHKAKGALNYSSRTYWSIAQGSGTKQQRSWNKHGLRKSQKRNSVVRGKFRQIKSYTHVVFIFLQKKVRACDTPSLLPHLTVLSHYLPFSHSGYYLN